MFAPFRRLRRLLEARPAVLDGMVVCSMGQGAPLSRRTSVFFHFLRPKNIQGSVCHHARPPGMASTAPRPAPKGCASGFLTVANFPIQDLPVALTRAGGHDRARRDAVSLPVRLWSPSTPFFFFFMVAALATERPGSWPTSHLVPLVRDRERSAWMAWLLRREWQRQ